MLYTSLSLSLYVKVNMIINKTTVLSISATESNSTQHMQLKNLNTTDWVCQISKVNNRPSNIDSWNLSARQLKYWQLTANLESSSSRSSRWRAGASATCQCSSNLAPGYCSYPSSFTPAIVNPASFNYGRSKTGRVNVGRMSKLWQE